MKLFLLRHTEVKYKDVCYGFSDMPLADSFEFQKNEVLNHLKSYSFSKMITSPLSRCYRLASFLSEKLNLELTQDELLKELNFGNWENQKWSDIDKAEIDLWFADFTNNSTPGGESYSDLLRRVKSYLFQKECDTILLVTHGGVIRALLSEAMQLSLKHAFNLNIDYGALSLIERKEQRLSIDFINRV